MKLSNDGEYQMGRGISFHIWGEAEEKVVKRYPVVVVVQYFVYSWGYEYYYTTDYCLTGQFFLELLHVAHF